MFVFSFYDSPLSAHLFVTNVVSGLLFGPSALDVHVRHSFQTLSLVKYVPENLTHKSIKHVWHRSFTIQRVRSLLSKRITYKFGFRKSCIENETSKELHVFYYPYTYSYLLENCIENWVWDFNVSNMITNTPTW